LGRYSEAEASYRQAIALKLDHAEAYSNLGNTLKELGRYSEAETSCRQAIALKPDHAEAYSNLGNALNELGRHEEAETIYRQAIALKPDFAEAYSNLGNVLNELGRHEEAETNYRQAIALKPDSIEYIIREKLLLPYIYTSVSSIDEWRQRYQLGLEEINVFNLKINTPIIKISNCTFNLAYHNLCNLKLIQRRSTLTRRSVINIAYTSPHVMQWTKPVCRKIRIAFCSRYMVMHTIGKLYQGLIKKLDRSIFELILIHTPSSKLDNLSQQLDQVVDKAIFLSPILSIQHEQIAMEKLDILFYPDIGMEPETYHLAHARLAPIQIVSWGHPDSSGIDSLDYFLSSSLIEPENAGQYYSEKLIQLNRLPTYYEPPIAETQFDDRTSLGLPTSGTLYGCPQSLFKIHPDFDPILANILYKDSTAHLIFLEGKTSAWSSLLRKRWGAHYPVINERVIFLPRLPMDKFMALMGKMDILLDPIHFGSGNTFYESMIYGVPTVTWSGRFMRGRIVAGAYKQMGITDAPIAERLTDYANLAVELGNDDEKRSHLKERLLNAAKEHLFSDISIVQEFEKFFLAAIDVADKGERLKTGWIPK
jgi:predicted O-linked N-acetylglucosamine transferase (SPINDLY family)